MTHTSSEVQDAAYTTLANDHCNEQRCSHYTEKTRRQSTNNTIQTAEIITMKAKNTTNRKTITLVITVIVKEKHSSMKCQYIT